MMANENTTNTLLARVAPAMYEMLKETLDWLDEQYPADKYPLDPDNQYRRNLHDLVIARRRENIRSVIAQVEQWREVAEECYA
jgi:hypothetical protein